MEKLTIGKLAKLTGLTVRALHYYEQEGLMSPASRTPKGYRLYGASDVARLQQIQSLKALGFGLADIKKHLHNPHYSLLHILPKQLEQIKSNIARQQNLVGWLESLQAHLKRGSKISIETFTNIMNQMQNIPKADFNEEEKSVIAAQGKKLGDDHIRAVEAEWPGLIKKVQQMIADGVDPKNAQAQAAAKRWMELVKEFTAGHKGVELKLGKMYQENAAQMNFGDPNGANMQECFIYIQKALN